MNARERPGSRGIRNGVQAVRLEAGIADGRWNPHMMVWTYLALAAGILVLLNVIVVVALALASRPRHDDNDVA